MRKRCVAVLFISILLGLKSQSANADDTKPKAAHSASTTTNPVITINNPFTKQMADAAGLDPTNPVLSVDGIRSDPPTIASAECLFAETVVQKSNKNISAAEAKTYCGTLAKAGGQSFESGLQAKTDTPMSEALIHIVRWDDGKWNGTWYRYERGSGRGKGVLIAFSNKDAITSPPDHLLARGGLGFLAIHLNIDDSCDISYGLKSTQITPLNKKDVADLISLAESYYAKGANSNASKNTSKGGAGNIKPQDVTPASPEPTNVGVWGGQLILSLAKMPASIVFTPTMKAGVRADAEKSEGWDVTHTCKAKPKEEKPIDLTRIDPTQPSGNIGVQDDHVGLTLVSTRANDRENQAATKPKESSSAGSKPNTTDDQSGSDQKTKDTSSLSGAGLTVIDEGLHWWDVSVALPVTSYNKLTYNSQDNLLVVKNTNDIKPYALFDLYFGPADLRMKSGISKPMLSVGLPLSSQPLQKPFVGFGTIVAIKGFRFQPLVGVRVEKDNQTGLTNGSPVTPPELASDLHGEWHAKLQVMLGFSVSDALSVLGLKKK